MRPGERERAKIKAMLNEAEDDVEDLEIWFSVKMGKMIGDMVDAGIEPEDLSIWLGDFARWLRKPENLKLFNF